MADRTQSDKIVQINPNFPIPDGLNTFLYQDTESELDTSVEDYVNLDADEAVDDIFVESDEDSEEDVESDDSPDTPEIYGIISQTIRTAADGTQVVDVVLDVEDVNGMSKYDIRISL